MKRQELYEKLFNNQISEGNKKKIEKTFNAMKKIHKKDVENDYLMSRDTMVFCAIMLYHIHEAINDMRLSKGHREDLKEMLDVFFASDNKLRAKESGKGVE